MVLIAGGVGSNRDQRAVQLLALCCGLLLCCGSLCQGRMSPGMGWGGGRMVCLEASVGVVVRAMERPRVGLASYCLPIPGCAPCPWSAAAARMPYTAAAS
uniref:DUF3778 domain-containing protein n=1 Tax=Oryza glumipatula TaxID=40148 RepID=A0A0D9YEJ4_9ORYZ